MAGPVSVTFAPSGVTSWVSPGDTVLSAARRAGVAVSASCAGRGTCGECAVRVLQGELGEVGAVEARALGRAAQGVRLACQASVVGPVTVRPVISLGVQAGKLDMADAGELLAALDLGTTNVNAVVIDASRHAQVGSSAVPNQQSSWGADVLSRLGAALQGDGEGLREAAERSIEAALEASVPGALGRIGRLVISGNTAMSALLVGADVTSLATHPFAIPPTMGPLPSDSALRERLMSSSRVDVVPPLAGFVGGDLVAGLIALDMRPGRRTELLVDLGTNAEVVLSTDKGLFCASAAAGPAFEGGGLSCGGPAVRGAVSRVRVDPDGDVGLEVMGGGAPSWFSGAGLVSAVAALRVAGHLDSSGLMLPEGPLYGRFSPDDDGILGVDLGEGDGCLRMTQLDVRALQLAKGAVRSAIQMVLTYAGVRARDLDALRLGGAFGDALDARDLVTLGLVPHETAGVVAWEGNTSLRGAVALALDDTLWFETRSMTENVSSIDLAADPGFGELLMKALAFEEYSV